MTRQEISASVAYVFPNFDEVRTIEGDLKILSNGNLIDKKGQTWHAGTWALTKEEAIRQVRLDLESRRHELQEEITLATDRRQKLDKLWEGLK